MGKTLFKELEAHLLEDERPSRYLASIKDMPGAAGYPFNMLAHLQNTPQSPQHHPEGNVGTIRCWWWSEAAKVKGKSKKPGRPDVGGSAARSGQALHDAKPQRQITSYDHDKAGAALAGEYLAFFSADEVLIREVAALCGITCSRVCM
jgi:hypothetical protein